MQSDDDSYEYRRHARRRGRRRPHGYHPSKHQRSSNNSNTTRLLVIAALFCLLVYELVVLRSPLKQRRQHVPRSAPAPPPPPPHPVHAPPQPVAVPHEEARVAAAERGAREEADDERGNQRVGEEGGHQRERERERDERPAGGGDDAPAPPQPPEASRRGGPKRRPRVEPGTGENFWDWYQKSRRGGKVRCGERNRRLCQMTYKFVHKYKVRVLYDASCARTAGWMKPVILKVSREIWGFRYICALPGPAARRTLRDMPFVTFSDAKWWRAGFPPDADLIFAWDVLAHTAYGRVWAFFVNVRRANAKYVLVDNYPGILNDPSPERFYLNLRKHPFRFPAAKEVIQNVTEPGETANRQLLFYEGSQLPDNLG